MVDKTEGFFLIIPSGQFDPLKDGIDGLDESVARRMAAYWLGSHDAMIQPIEKLQKKLRKALTDEKVINNVLDRLPKRSYDLLYCFLAEGGSLSNDELNRFPRSKEEKLSDIIEPLRTRGLVWEYRNDSKDLKSARITVLPKLNALLSLPIYLEGKYGTLLPKRTPEQIRNLLEHLGCEEINPENPLQGISWLKKELTNPSKLRRFFDSLDISNRKLLKILSLHPDGLTPEELVYEYSLFVNEDSEEKLVSGMDLLRDQFGLIDIKIREVIIGRKLIKQAVYRLPLEMTQILQSNFKLKYEDHIPALPIFRPPDEDFALGARGKERPTLWIDFQQLLNHLIRCEVGVIRKGGMHKKNLKRILDRLEGQLVDAYLYLDFLFLYAHQRKILFPDGERWRIDVKQILPIQNEEAFYRDFWAFYRNNGSWNDRDSSPLQGVLQKGEIAQIFSLRRAVLRMLTECPVGQWIEMREFFDHLCDRELTFQLAEPAQIASDPVKEKFRFVKSTLERSLCWIGLVQTTTVPSQRISLFRLTEIGSWLLDAAQGPSPLEKCEETHTITMMSNLEIHIPPGFPIEKQLYLASFTDDQKGRIVLNRASIRRGLNEGLTVREMKDFLYLHTEGEVPPNAPHLLEEVSEKAGHILIGGEPIQMEVNSHSLLDELMVQKRFMPFIGERSSEKKAFLRNDADLQKLMEELRRAGYTPRSV